MSDFDLPALGSRIKQERRLRGLSLDALAARSQVSRSMLAAVESGDKAPTVLVLHRIASGMGTSMTRLLGDERSERVVLLKHADQIVARDPSGWERRNLAPPVPGIDFEFMRTTLPAGTDAGIYPPHAPGAREYVAVESGRLRLTIDTATYDLDAGDSISYAADCSHGFANPGETTCVYYLALESGTGAVSHVRKEFE